MLLGRRQGLNQMIWIMECEKIMDKTKTQVFTKEQFKDLLDEKEVLTYDIVKVKERLIDLPRDESFIMKELDNPDNHRLGDCINCGCGNKHYKLLSRVGDFAQVTRMADRELNNQNVPLIIKVTLEKIVKRKFKELSERDRIFLWHEDGSFAQKENPDVWVKTWKIFERHKINLKKPEEKANLGLATTKELLTEITTRIEMAGNLDYKTYSGGKLELMSSDGTVFNIEEVGGFPGFKIKFPKSKKGGI